MLSGPVALTAALTAGGQSSRFGSDKALARWQGRSLLEHAAAGLAWCERRLLIAPPGKYTLPGWETWPDTRPGEGPLAGLETALLHTDLAHAPAGWVAFAGVDNPVLTPEYWHALLAARRSDALSVQALDPERGPQPLGALYHTALLPRVTALLGAGERRLRLAAPARQTVLVPGLPPAFFQNVNRPADLAELSDLELGDLELGNSELGNLELDELKRAGLDG